MDNFNVYKDIQARTKGEVYIGVVGPVRTGKSTFIKRFMDLMVLPGMEDEHDKEFTDIVMDKINEMIDAGWITEDAAVGLYDNVTEGMQELKPLAAEDITEENTCETEIPEQEEVVSTEEE